MLEPRTTSWPFPEVHPCEYLSSCFGHISALGDSAFRTLPVPESQKGAILEGHPNLPTTKRPRIPSRYPTKTSLPNLLHPLTALAYSTRQDHPQNAGPPKVHPKLAPHRRLATAKLPPPSRRSQPLRQRPHEPPHAARRTPKWKAGAPRRTAPAFETAAGAHHRMVADPSSSCT